MRTPSRRKPSKIESVALLISTRPPSRSERYDCAFWRTRLESVIYQYPPMIAERKTKQQSIAHRRGKETRGRNGLPGRHVRAILRVASCNAPVGFSRAQVNAFRER